MLGISAALHSSAPHTRTLREDYRLSYHSIGKQRLARRKDGLFKWKSTWPRTDHNSLKKKFLCRNSLALPLAFLSWLSLTACGSVTQTATTTGTPPPPSGTGQLSVSRTSMDFGNVVVGSISTQIIMHFDCK